MYICVILRQKIVFEILFPGVLYIYIAIFCDLICVQFGVFINPLFADPYGLILTPHAFSLQISKWARLQEHEEVAHPVPVFFYPLVIVSVYL